MEQKLGVRVFLLGKIVIHAYYKTPRWVDPSLNFMWKQIWQEKEMPHQCLC